MRDISWWGWWRGTPMGVTAAAYYAFAYVLMNFACFWVVCRESGDGRNLKLEDLNGLSKRAPGLALVLAVGAVALVGLPPTAGFMGKFFSAHRRLEPGLQLPGGDCRRQCGHRPSFTILNLVRHAYAKGKFGDNGNN